MPEAALSLVFRNHLKITGKEPVFHGNVPWSAFMWYVFHESCEQFWKKGKSVACGDAATSNPQ